MTWGPRTTVLTDEQVLDVMEHCTRAAQDVDYAEKHGCARSTITRIRLGRGHWRLRLKRLGEELGL